MRIYLAEHKTEAGGHDIEDGCLGLEILSRIVDFE